jgi:hypothetical protein
MGKGSGIDWLIVACLSVAAACFGLILRGMFR